LINKKMAGNNNALRSDLASLENNEFFSASYRGTVNYYPIGPEKFELTHPVNHDTLESGETTFAWEMARDADLYDEVNYYLLLERVFKADIQNSHLYSLLENSQKNGYDLQRLIQQARAELFLVKNSDFNFNASENQASLTIQKLPAGDYYWTIIAYDRDDHYRINTNGLRSFIILWPDLRIKKLEFDPLPWITENDTQGVISAQIENSGEIKAENILVTVLSSLITKNYPAVTPPIIHQACIPELNAHEIYRLPFNWLEANSGSYQIQVRANVIEPDNKIGREGNLANNVGSTIFHTIPKGRFASQDTAIAFIYPWTRYDVPFVNRIFFDLNSSEVKPSYYYDSEWLYPPFRILAERLNKRTDIFLQLEGFADTSKKESLEIAKRRAESVRNILLMLGVNAQQLPLTGLSWQLSLARKITANEDVQEERRFVRLIPTRFDNGQTDNSLLEPVPFETIQQQPVSLPVIFRNTIGGIIPIQNGELRIQSSGTAASLIFTYSKTAQDTVAWVPTQLAGSIWLNNNVSYQIVMTDTLQRQFKTRPKAVHLKKLNTYLPSVVGLAEFNDPIPFPIIPLEKLFHELRIRFTYDKKVRFRFIGHACGIPPQPVNDRYSNLRAQLFQEIFLRELEKQKDIEPQLYHLISDRLDQKGAMGYSSFQPYKCVVAQERLSEHKKHFNNGSYEKILQSVYQENGKVMKPFIFKRQGGEISLVGDNETPEGRHINRRIEIELFIPNGKFVDLIPASKLK